jgi:hypothetical protein
MPKRRVTMTSVYAQADGSIGKQVATDYVSEEVLDAYMADAESRWQLVTVSEEYDDGPGGPDGETIIPDNLVVGAE